MDVFVLEMMVSGIWKFQGVVFASFEDAQHYVEHYRSFDNDQHVIESSWGVYARPSGTQITGGTIKMSDGQEWQVRIMRCEVMQPQPAPDTGSE